MALRTGGVVFPVHVKHVCEKSHMLALLHATNFGREITVLPILRGFVFVAVFFGKESFSYL